MGIHVRQVLDGRRATAEELHGSHRGKNEGQREEEVSHSGGRKGTGGRMGGVRGHRVTGILCLNCTPPIIPERYNLGVEFAYKTSNLITCRPFFHKLTGAHRSGALAPNPTRATAPHAPAAAHPCALRGYQGSPSSESPSSPRPKTSSRTGRSDTTPHTYPSTDTCRRAHVSSELRAARAQAPAGGMARRGRPRGSSRGRRRALTMMGSRGGGGGLSRCWRSIWARARRLSARGGRGARGEDARRVRRTRLARETARETAGARGGGAGGGGDLDVFVADVGEQLWRELARGRRGLGLRGRPAGLSAAKCTPATNHQAPEPPPSVVPRRGGRGARGPSGAQGGGEAGARPHGQLQGCPPIRSLVAAWCCAAASTGSGAPPPARPEAPPRRPRPAPRPRLPPRCRPPAARPTRAALPAPPRRPAVDRRRARDRLRRPHARAEPRRRSPRPRPAPRCGCGAAARERAIPPPPHLEVRDATCPLSTRGGTRLLRLVRGREGGGGCDPARPPRARCPRRRARRPAAPPPRGARSMRPRVAGASGCSRRRGAGAPGL